MDMVPKKYLQNPNPFKHFPSAAADMHGPLLTADIVINCIGSIAGEDELPWKGDKWRILPGKLRLLLKV